MTTTLRVPKKRATVCENSTNTDPRQQLDAFMRKAYQLQSLRAALSLVVGGQQIVHLLVVHLKYGGFDRVSVVVRTLPRDARKQRPQRAEVDACPSPAMTRRVRNPDCTQSSTKGGHGFVTHKSLEMPRDTTAYRDRWGVPPWCGSCPLQFGRTQRCKHCTRPAPKSPIHQYPQTPLPATNTGSMFD